jgi:hypothetical protein
MKKSIEIFIALIFILFFQANKAFPQAINYQYNWYKYYTPVEGKIIGIWPHLSRWNNIERLKELKYRWGFNFLAFWSWLGKDIFENAKQLGFNPSTNIMRIVEPDNYQDAIEFNQCWAYYLDEPADRGIPFTMVSIMKDWLKTNFANSLFVISGYKRNSDLINYVNALADKVLFSSYVHWWEILGYWVSWPEDPDQRSDWTDMKNLFGSKFSLTWINANKDLSEYEGLVGHAANLGQNGIWFYEYDPETEVDDNNFERFANACTTRDFLRANYQQVRDLYSDGNFISRQFVGPSYSSIPHTFDHSNYVFSNTTVTNNRIDDYFATNILTAGFPYLFIIPSSKRSTLNSNNEIILKPGFEAQSGCEFRAYISK